MLPFGLAELLRWLTDDGVHPLSIAVRSEGDAVTVAFVDHGEILSEMDIEAVRQVHETQIEHTQGLEMWLVRWLVTDRTETRNFALGCSRGIPGECWTRSSKRAAQTHGGNGIPGCQLLVHRP